MAVINSNKAEIEWSVLGWTILALLFLIVMIYFLKGSFSDELGSQAGQVTDAFKAIK